jgi:hypothetical protein
VRAINNNHHCCIAALTSNSAARPPDGLVTGILDAHIASPGGHYAAICRARKALGLTIPQSILVQADQIIE